MRILSMQRKKVWTRHIKITKSLHRSIQALWLRISLDYRRRWRNGRKDSKEFMAISEIGRIRSVIRLKVIMLQTWRWLQATMYQKSHETQLELEKVATPNVKSIDEVADFFSVEPQNHQVCIVHCG